MWANVWAKTKRLFGRLKLQQWLDLLKQKGLRYWISAFLIFLLTIGGSEKVYEFLHLENARAVYFQFLLDRPRLLVPRYVSVVLVDDDEFWNGEPAGRAPIKRTYLARLVEQLGRANARVIALDFDGRLPNPESNEIPADYKEETCTLIGAIKNAAGAGRKVVVPSPAHYVGGGRYRQESDIYQSNGLCGRPRHAVSDAKPCGIDFTPQEKEKVTCGYIALPYDLLEVPVQIDMDDGGTLDSFALATARADRPTFVEDLLREAGDDVRYGNFISEDKFKKAKAWFSSKDVLDGNARLQLDAVIVGANWRGFAAGRGIMVDQHRTPLGNMVGALLHANFAEAVLDSRTFGTAPKWVLHALEILVSVAAAIGFALIPGFWTKLGGMFFVLAALFFIQWLVLRELGMFFDAFFPVLGLGLHSVYERLLGAHEAHHAAGAGV